MVVWLVDNLFRLAMLAIVARSVLLWIGLPPSHGLGKVLHDVTQPLLQPFQQRLNMRRAGIDFSPVAALLALVVVRWIIIRVLNG